MTATGYKDNGDGTISVTMQRDDFSLLLMLVGFCAGRGKPFNADECFALCDRLNKGNPQYTPYGIK